VSFFHSEVARSAVRVEATNVFLHTEAVTIVISGTPLACFLTTPS
jgi:hypothetical protein